MMFMVQHTWDDRKKVWAKDVEMASGSKDGQIMKIWSIPLQLAWPGKTQEVSVGQGMSVQLSGEAWMRNERAVVSLVGLCLSQGTVRHPKPPQD